MVFFAEKNIPIPPTDILSWIFDQVPYDIDEPILLDAADPNRSISNRQAKALIRKLIAGLKRWGIRPGQNDVVCLHSFNDILYTILVLGVIGAGGIITGTNPAYTPYELAHQIRTAEVKYLITEPEMLGPIIEAADECKLPRSNILVFNILNQPVPKGFRSWETLLQHGEEDWHRFNNLGLAKTAQAARLFSSGTTGLPKAALTSHYNLVAQHELVYGQSKRDYRIKLLLPLPMFHAAAFPVAHTTALKAGNITYVMRRFDLETFLKNVEYYQITDLAMVPPIIIQTIMSPLSRKYSLRSLRSAQVGAASLSKDAQKRFESLLEKNVQCTQVWGMTETTCMGLCFPWPERDRTGSIGRPLPNLDVKIVNESGADISAYDVTGELCIRGPTIISGYLNNPTANEEFDADGFYHTGDIVYCDSKTRLWYIVDRKKELIKVRGFQVAPPELEAVLFDHPQIADAAVIGVPSQNGDDQVPRAYVVRKPGAALTAAEVKKHVAKRLARFKHLEGGVIFVPAIPKNASGKILKRLLRDEAKKEMTARL
ncbi:MAG: hypothetical protein Q9195_007266 [Heterodermia aff. obscurata]